jgi:hypothetical protein
MAGQKYDRLNRARLLDLSEELDRPMADDLTKSQRPTLDIVRFRDFEALYQGGDEPLTVLDYLKLLAKVETDRFNLQTLGNAFTPFNITILTTPTLILPPNKTARGYLFLNPSQNVSGPTVSSNLFAPAVRGAGTYTSAAVNVSGVRSSRFFLNITAAPATLTVEIQTQDPQTGAWAVAQSDIFGGAVAVTPPAFYANLGEIGTDSFIRAVVVQTGAGANWSLTMVNKEAFGATVAGFPIFLGNQNVIAGLGYPILGGQERSFWLMDNTPLFGIAVANTELRVFQLQ